MASVQLKQLFEGKSDMEVYEAALQAIPNAGMQVWKKRELARLVMGMGSHEGQEVRCNVVVSMVDGSVTVSMEADDLEEARLTPLAERLMAELVKLLS